jgi:hypothetical protein
LTVQAAAAAERTCDLGRREVNGRVEKYLPVRSLRRVRFCVSASSSQNRCNNNVLLIAPCASDV